MAYLFKRKPDGPWLIRYVGHDGKTRQRSAKTRDKRVAQQLAGKLENEEMLRRSGLIDPKAEKRALRAAVPIGQHLAAFEAHLATSDTPRHVKETMKIVRDLIAATGVETVVDLDPDRIEAAIGSPEEGVKGRSPRSINKRVRAIKSFSRWLVKYGRAEVDALAPCRRSPWTWTDDANDAS